MLPNVRPNIPVLALLVLIPLTAYAQSDPKRETIAITYPLEQTISVKFRGTTRLPRLKGEAKVTRSGRRGTRVQMSIEDLPRAYELGSVYTTFVLWAISPEGHADNLGEIKRGGGRFVNSKIDVTTPLETFALIVTAEPHYLVRTPSRMVVLENLPPRDPGDATVATVPVTYVGNTSDYFRDPRIPDLADQDLTRMPTSLLGARQAINLARYAGAERDAPEELQEAKAQLDQAENAWRLNQQEAEVDVIARRAISLGAKAEEDAEIHAAARKRREEIASREAFSATLEFEQKLNLLSDQIANLERARPLSDEARAAVSRQLNDMRAEQTRLQAELQQKQDEIKAADDKIKRLEEEKRKELEQSQRENDKEALRRRVTVDAAIKVEEIHKQSLRADIAEKSTSTLSNKSNIQGGQVLVAKGAPAGAHSATEVTRGSAAKITPANRKDDTSGENAASSVSRPPDYAALLDEEYSKLKPGVTIFDPPKRMVVDQPETVTLRIAKQATEAILEDWKGTHEIDVETIKKVAPLMRVQLKGEGFKIISTNHSEEQAVTSEGFTEWSWNVVPRSPGTHKLSITVTVILKTPDGEKTKDYPSFDKDIDVAVSSGYYVSKFTAFFVKNWQKVLSTLIGTGIFGGLLAWWRKRREKEPPAKSWETP